MNSRVGAVAIALLLATSACGSTGAPPSSPAAASSAPGIASTSAVPAASAASAASGAANVRASGASAANSPSASQLTHLKSAYTAPSVVNAPLFVAVDEGMFRKQGLDVSLELVKNTAVPASLMTGELDFAIGGGNEVVHSDLNGASLAMVATASDYPIFSLFATKNYPKVQDLAGQKVGITGPGSATDAAAHLFLGHYNLMDSVKLAPTGTVPAIIAAMGQGLIAGGILSPPTTAKASKQGYLELINGVTLGEPMTHAGILIGRSYLKDHRDVARRILMGYMDAWRYVATPANKAQVVKSVAKYTKSEAAQAEAAYQAMLPVWQKKPIPTVDPAGIAAVLKLSDEAKARSAKPEEFIDNSLINQIAH